MRNSKAIKIRKEVYGENMSPRHRRYFINQQTGQIFADALRRAYKKAKREVK